MRLLVDSQLFPAFDHLFREGNISTRPKSFFNTLFNTSQFPKMVEKIFENSPGIFKVFTLPLKIPDNAWPLEAPQNCVTPFKNFKTLKPISVEISHDFFYLITPGSSTLFLISQLIPVKNFCLEKPNIDWDGRVSDSEKSFWSVPDVSLLSM